MGKLTGRELTAGKSLHDCWQAVLQPRTATGDHVTWDDFDAEQQAIWDDAARAFTASLLARRDRALVGVCASLAAAISLLEHGGKKAAASDKMFEQMLVDYRASLETGRQALTGEPG